MRKRILLTGATGFVGRHILAALCKADIDLLLVVRDSSESCLPLASVVEVLRTRDLFKESAEWWAAVCQGVDIVIHAAWYAESGEYMKSPKNFDCLAGTLQLASGCVKAGVQRFVGIGSCSEYDVRFGNLSIDTPLSPTTPYAGAKAATFLALSTLLPQQGIEFAWARLFYLYGEGEDARRLVPYLHSRLSEGKVAELTSGTQVRDFLDVAHAGERISELALANATGPYNICSGQAKTVRALAEQIADKYGRRDLLQFGKRGESHFDPPYVVGVPSAIS